jgi:4'-phosphopantetheinyl transferase
LSKSPANDGTPVATVWLVDGRTVDDEIILLSCLGWLNPAETERYRRFLRPERQRQFLIGRILLRHALGDLLEVPPQKISLTERVTQAPLLNWPSPTPGFSLSHSGPWIACAVSMQTMLGLDVEMKNADRDLIALGEQAFDAGDAALIKAKQGEDRIAIFYELWSKKEASYKLASTCGSNVNENYIVLSHPEISIVLCSEQPLAAAPIREFNHWLV